MKRILLVEDEVKVIKLIQTYLEKEGFVVDQALTGTQALELFQLNDYHLIVLDLMLPDMMGEEICKTIRKQSNVPIIILTAKSSTDDKIDNLYNGADDYLVKPFSARELVARIHALFRRTKEIHSSHSFEYKDLKVDLALKMVYKNNEEVALTAMEYKLLEYFVRHPKQVFSREQIIERVFSNDFDGYDRTIDAHIKNLRQKIEDDTKKPIYILTVYGLGYRFGGESI